MLATEPWIPTRHWEDWVFIHVPRTGGGSIRTALWGNTKRDPRLQRFAGHPTWLELVETLPGLEERCQGVLYVWREDEDRLRSVHRWMQRWASAGPDYDLWLRYVVLPLRDRTSHWSYFVPAMLEGLVEPGTVNPETLYRMLMSPARYLEGLDQDADDPQVVGINFDVLEKVWAGFGFPALPHVTGV